MATDQEQAAKAFVAGGDGAATGLVDLLHRVCKEDQRALYYSGGLRVIAQTLTDGEWDVIQSIYVYTYIEPYRGDIRRTLYYSGGLRVIAQTLIDDEWDVIQGIYIYVYIRRAL